MIMKTDDFFNWTSIENLEKYADWLNTFFVKEKDGKLYWTDDKAAEEYSKTKEALKKRKNDEAIWELRREFMDFYKGGNK